MVRRILSIALGAALLWAAPAAAHIQVSPTTAAPDDAVRFELLVPNESDAATVEVSLQIPKGVLPFSFEETPGWKRTTEKGSDGAIAVVKWTGDLGPETFARFSFLAATPPSEGELAWKALQKYDDGTTVRWIGTPDSEEPAAVTKITKSAPLQNAGGETAADSGASPAPAATATTPQGSGDAAATEDDGGRDPLTLGLAIAALALAVAALVAARRRDR